MSSAEAEARRLLAVGAGCLVVAGLVLVAVLLVDAVPAFDRWVSESLVPEGRPSGSWLVELLSRSADAEVRFVALLPVLALLAAWRRPFMVAALVVAAYLTAVLTRLLKAAVGIPRPELAEGVVQVDLHAWPSGHSSGAASIYLAAALAIALAGPPLRRRPRLAVALVALGAAWSILVGIARILLGAHWPSDVVAGLLLGTGTACLALAAARFAEARRLNPQASPPAG